MSDEHKAQIKEIVGWLAGAYDKRLYPETAATYAASLYSFTAEQVRDAVSEIIAGNSEWPSIADIRLYITRKAIGAPLPHEAWAQVWMPGSHRHDFVNEIVDAMGGVGAINEMKDGRSAFIFAYRDHLMSRLQYLNLYHLNYCYNGVCRPLEGDDATDRRTPRLDAGAVPARRSGPAPVVSLVERRVRHLDDPEGDDATGPATDDPVDEPG